MKIIIAGGHGKIALILGRLLADAGHHPVGLIRNPDQAADLVEAAILDIEHTTPAELEEVLRGADAAVFSAGAGGGDSIRTVAIDRDGAIMFANAAVAAGVRRFVMVSSVGADGFDPASNDGFQIYLRSKSEADAEIRQLDLDWTIVRPVTLADTPGTGLVTAATSVDLGSAERGSPGRASIPRDDVAATVFALLTSGAAIRTQFELTAGWTPIAQALAELQ